MDVEVSTFNSAADPYYRRHRLISTVYRLCAFLGWVELFRQETTFLDPSSGTRERIVDHAIFALRADLADRELNTAPDWEDWHDVLIYRDEQRAIGESMIIPGSGGRNVMGYAQFCDLVLADTQTSPAKWIWTAARVVLDLKPPKDFRQVRMQRLIVHLVDLVELLASSRLRDDHREARKQYETLLQQSTA